MGMQFLIETRTMKFFQVGVLALAAIACAEPEADAKADPAYFYGNYYGYPSYYSGYGYRSYASPYWGGYYNRGYGYWKRDADSQPEAAAEANAEADPAFFYRNYFYNPYYNSHSWGMNRHMDMSGRHMDEQQAHRDEPEAEHEQHGHEPDADEQHGHEQHADEQQEHDAVQHEQELRLCFALGIQPELPGIQVLQEGGRGRG